jgi:hypothetical protein
MRLGGGSAYVGTLAVCEQEAPLSSGAEREGQVPARERRSDPWTGPCRFDRGVSHTEAGLVDLSAECHTLCFP